MTHQVAEAVRALAIHKNGLLFAVIGCEFDLNIHADSIFLQLHTHRSEVRRLTDDLFILAGAMAAAQGTVVDSLQQIRLARAILAEEDVHPRVGCNLQLLIVAKVPQF